MRAAGAMLARALEARGCRVLAADERPWASVTFTGARHRLRLAVADEAFLAGIEEVTFDLGEHLLADLAIERSERSGGELIVAIGALTIEQHDLPAVDRPAQGQTEPARPTKRGTKRAFVPLAIA